MRDEPPAHICPSCRSDDVMRVPRTRSLDYVVRLLGWRVYRCVRCGTRFYDRPTLVPSLGALAAPEAAELVARLAQSC